MGTGLYLAELFKAEVEQLYLGASGKFDRTENQIIKQHLISQTSWREMIWVIVRTRIYPTPLPNMIRALCCQRNVRSANDFLFYQHWRSAGWPKCEWWGFWFQTCYREELLLSPAPVSSESSLFSLRCSQILLLTWQPSQSSLGRCRRLQNSEGSLWRKGEQSW